MFLKISSGALCCALTGWAAFAPCAAQNPAYLAPPRARLSPSSDYDPRVQFGFLEATAVPGLKVFHPDAVAFIDVSTDRPNTRLEFIPQIGGSLQLTAIYEYPQDGQWPKKLGIERTHAPVVIPLPDGMAERMLKVLRREIDRSGKVANTGRDGLYYVFGVRQADGTFKMARVWSPNRYDPARLAEITDILLKLRFAYTDKETQARLVLVEALLAELETNKNAP